MKIKKYYEIFDCAYKKESKAKEIESEWYPKDYVKPIFVIVSPEEEEEEMIVLEHTGSFYNSNLKLLKEEFQEGGY